MKIALIMFGLVRNSSQMLRRFDILKNNYLEGLNVDIFCVTNTIGGVQDWSKGEKNINETDKIDLSEVIKRVSSKMWIATEYPDELRDTSHIVSGLKERFPTPAQPIQNTVSKWYKLNRVFEVCSLAEYDIVMCCRMDCQFIHKFSHEQLMTATKLHTLSPLWAGKHCHGVYERSEDSSARISQQVGYPDDFFYGPPHAVVVFKEMLQFLKDLTPAVCQFHPETIYTNFLRHHNIHPELIRWSKRITDADFEKRAAVINHIGHTYPPELTTEWIAKIL